MGGWGNDVGGRAARVWAGGLAVAFLAVGASHRDVEAVAFSVLTVVALAATRFGRGTAGRIGFGFLSVDTMAWMVPAAFVNVTTGGSVRDVAIPAGLATLSLGLLVLALGVPPRPALAVGGAAIVGTLAGMVVARSVAEPLPAASATVTMRNVAFSPSAIEVGSPGTAAIAVSNRDLFWHTFTVKGLDIEVAVPTGSTRVIAVDAPPGTYEFVCVIPGHEAAGMEGTITVR